MQPRCWLGLTLILAVIPTLCFGQDTRDIEYQISRIENKCQADAEGTLSSATRAQEQAENSVNESLKKNPVKNFDSEFHKLYLEALDKTWQEFRNHYLGFKSAISTYVSYQSRNIDKLKELRAERDTLILWGEYKLALAKHNCAIKQANAMVSIHNEFLNFTNRLYQEGTSANEAGLNRAAYVHNAVATYIGRLLDATRNIVDALQ